MKAFFEKNYNGEPYDALARRKNQNLFYILGGGKVAPPPAKSSAAAYQPKTVNSSVSSSVGSGAVKKTSTGIGMKSSGMGGGASQAQVAQLEN